MQISELIERLERIKHQHGDLEVTTTGSLLPEENKPLSDVFESTVESMRVEEGEKGMLPKKRLKLYWQT